MGLDRRDQPDICGGQDLGISAELIVPTTYLRIEKPFQKPAPWRDRADNVGTVFIYTDYPDLPADQLRAAFMEILGGTDLWDGKVGVTAR